MKRALSFVFAVMFIPVMAMASDAPQRTIAVSGVGEVTAVPDMATLSVGVTHEDDDAAEAMQQASEGAADVIVRLSEAGVADRDVQTSAVSLRPVWSNNRNSDDAPEVTGFRASVSVTVRVRALGSLGDVLDAVVSEGANQVGGIQFGFQDPAPLMNAARMAAVEDGRAKAELYAQAAGVVLGPLLRLEEPGSGTPRPEGFTMASARDASVPIAEGELSVSARVSLIYSIAE